MVLMYCIGQQDREVQRAHDLVLHLCILEIGFWDFVPRDRSSLVDEQNPKVYFGALGSLANLQTI